MRDPMPVGEERQMDQPTFADLKYQGKKRKTRWELFLNQSQSGIYICGELRIGALASWYILVPLLEDGPVMSPNLTPGMYIPPWL